MLSIVLSVACAGCHWRREGCGTVAGHRWRRNDSSTVADSSRCVVAEPDRTDAVTQIFHFAMVSHSIEAGLGAVDGGGRWEEM